MVCRASGRSPSAVELPLAKPLVSGVLLVSATVLVLIVLSVAVGTGCLLGVIWMVRTLRWEVVEDDQFHDRLAGRNGRRWFGTWFGPRSPMLTYRRDERGRFRRYRR